MSAHQGKVIRINPHDAKLGHVCVVSGDLLQDFQELETVCEEEHNQPEAILICSLDAEGRTSQSLQMSPITSQKDEIVDAHYLS